MVSSRTYLSSLERGMKSPTLEKVDSLANKLDIHPATLIVLTYLQGRNVTEGSLEDLLNRVTQEVEELTEQEN